MKTKAQKQAKATKPATAGGIAAAVKQAVAKPTTKPEVKPVVVALRGGQAIATVTTAGAKAYRTKAKHNADWFAQVQSACAKKPASVAALIEAGVPSHFIGYCVRRGYAIGA